MRKLIVVLPLVALTWSCSNFGWRGSGTGVSEEQAREGIKDYYTLNSEYETEQFWKSVRARRDGRVNAFGRDLGRIQDIFDRYFFNYSPTDPYVNYPTQQTLLSQTGRFFGTFLAR
jgi:hypothetical protein